jgi:hypothetical protein
MPGRRPACTPAARSRRCSLCRRRTAPRQPHLDRRETGPHGAPDHPNSVGTTTQGRLQNVTAADAGVKSPRCHRVGAGRCARGSRRAAAQTRLLTQSGGCPLLEHMMVPVVVRRYRAPVALMLAVILIGQVLRMVITRRTPVVSARTRPGVMRITSRPVRTIAVSRQRGRCDPRSGPVSPGALRSSARSARTAPPRPARSPPGSTAGRPETTQTGRAG